jgi:hypothetical protein
MKINKNDLVAYQFNGIDKQEQQGRVLSICRKKYKDMAMIKILPLTELRGICRIPLKIIKSVIAHNLKHKNILVEEKILRA